jgi:hypothetical protein
MLLFPFLTILLSYLSLFLFYFFLLSFHVIFYVPSCLNIPYCNIFFHTLFFRFFVSSPFFLHPPHFRTFPHSFNRHTHTHTHTHKYHHHHHYTYTFIGWSLLKFVSKLFPCCPFLSSFICIFIIFTVSHSHFFVYIVLTFLGSLFI